MPFVVQVGEHGANSVIRHLLVIDGFTVNIVLIDDCPCLLDQVGVVARLVIRREERAGIRLVCEPAAGKRDEQQGYRHNRLPKPPAVVAAVVDCAVERPALIVRAARASRGRCGKRAIIMDSLWKLGNIISLWRLSAWLMPLLSMLIGLFVPARVVVATHLEPPSRCMPCFCVFISLSNESRCCNPNPLCRISQMARSRLVNRPGHRHTKATTFAKVVAFVCRCPG